jgi:nucleoside-diphosphate-sugar epimerase
MVDAMDRRGIERVIDKHGINEVYLLAALLSATAEKDPAFAWKLNMESLFIVLELAREGRLERVYWPSSIAVFGPHHTEGGHAATHHRGAQYRVWHQQTGR